MPSLLFATLTAWRLNIQAVQIVISPLAHCIQNRNNTLSKWGKRIYRLRRLFWNYFTMNHAVVFQIMKPMHATVAVLTALGTWKDVMTPLVMMSGTGKNTLPLAQLNFQTQFGTNYNLAFASYLLALIPIVIFYLVCQKQILNGVVNGAVK